MRSSSTNRVEKNAERNGKKGRLSTIRLGTYVLRPRSGPEGIMRRTLIAIAILTFAIPLAAEIEKHANPCGTSNCLYWWPKLPVVEGWHPEPRSSEQYAANTLA